MEKAKQAQKLMKDIDEKIDSWNERSMFKIKGVGNLSRADLDSIQFYAESIAKTGGYYGYMEPRGGVREVLGKYNLLSIELS